MRNLLHILTSTAAVALLCAGAWPMRAAGAGYVWIGGGADNAWTTLTNWVGGTNYPDGLTDTATIQTNLAPVNINLNGNRSLLSLSIAPYGEAGFQITNSTLTLAAGGSITADMTGSRGPNNQSWNITSAVNLLGDAMINNRTGGGYGRNLAVSGLITGSNTLYLAGAAGHSPGYWGVSVGGNNTGFTGTAVITNGAVGITHVNAFGTNATPIQLRGGNLALSVTGATKPVTVTTNSTITAWGNSTTTGAILLTNNPTLTLDAYNGGNSRTLGLNCAVSGTGNLAIVSIASGVTFGGTAANTFLGTVTITRDTLLLNKTPGQDAIPGNVTIGDGDAAQHILQLSNSNQVNDASVVGFGCTSTNPTYACFRLNGFSETVGGLQSTAAGFGTVENASSTTASTLTLNTLSNYTFSGVVRDGGTKALNVAVGGSGMQVFNGLATNSGTWTVTSGALGGTGTVAIAVLCMTNATATGAALAPGDSASTNGIRALRVNGVNLQGSDTASRAARLVIQADNYDRYCQLVVTGAVNLNANAAAQPALLVLNLSSNFTADVPGVFMKLIDNDGTDAISGAFQGIGELTQFQFTNAAHTVYTIEYTYKGGDGNDFGLVIANSPPPTPSNPYPADGALNVPPYAVLDWADALGAHGYGVYLWKDGTAQPTTPTASTVLSQYHPPGDLDWSTTYHWQIVTTNRIASATGPIWTFTTRPQQVPAVPVSPSPVDGAIGVLVGATLDWADSALVDQYRVFLWPASGSKPTTPTAIVTPSAYTPATNLAYDTPYLWQVVATNTVGSSTGAVWGFRSEKYLPQPLTATGPTNGATNMLAWMPLQWAGDNRASAYRVYVWHASETQPSVPTATVTNSFCFPYHYLDYATNYYWQVVGSNSIGMTTNPVWSFRTDAKGQRVATPAFDISPSAQEQRTPIYTKAGRALLSGTGTPLTTGTKIDLFGDSITWLNSYLSTIQSALNTGAGTSGRGITCINRGINGGGVLSIRDGSPDSGYPGSIPQAPFASVIASDQANVAVVYIGINDVWWRGTSTNTFEQALRDIVASANSAGVKLILATLSVHGEKPDGSNGDDPKIEQFAQITRNVAASTGKALVDLRRAYIAYLQNYNYVLNADGTITIPATSGVLTTDGVHPTSPLGVNMLADLISLGIYQGLRAPDAPASPVPANGATGTPVSTALDWGDILGASGYQVYLWPSSGTKPASPTTIIETSAYSPPLPLTSGTTYNWQVISTNAYGSTTGAVWTFTTVIPQPPTLPVSGFSRPGGVPTFDIPNTVSSSQYTLAYKNNLTDAAWIPLTGSGTAPGNGGTLRLSDPTVIGSLPAHRYYRLVRNP